MKKFLDIRHIGHPNVATVINFGKKRSIPQMMIKPARYTLSKPYRLLTM